MDELSRKFRSIDWKGLQKSARKVQASTASALKDMVMTDLENKTRAATADTAWGASGTDLMQIAQGTYRREDYALIMSIVWQRLASSRWRCVHKALELLRHLIMHGAARCAEEARMALPHLHALQQYHALDETGRDVGEAVRRRAKLVCDMLADAAVLDEERAKSRELRSKLQGGSDGLGPGGRLGGISSEDFRRGGFNNGGDAYGASDDPGPGAAARVATASFKGYGEDDADGNPYAYDAAPSGAFAARAAAAAAADGGVAVDEKPAQQPVVEDLLGDDEPAVPALPPASPEQTGVDVLADLDAPAHAGASPPAAAAAQSSANVPLSQLVSTLAAQQTANNMQVALPGAAGATDASATQPIPATTPDVADLFGAAASTTAVNGASADVSGVPPQPASPKQDGPKRVLNRVSEKEKDPFADLLSTGKQKGVL